MFLLPAVAVLDVLLLQNGVNSAFYANTVFEFPRTVHLIHLTFNIICSCCYKFPKTDTPQRRLCSEEMKSFRNRTDSFHTPPPTTRWERCPPQINVRIFSIRNLPEIQDTNKHSLRPEKIINLSIQLDLYDVPCSNFLCEILAAAVTVGTIFYTGSYAPFQLLIRPQNQKTARRYQLPEGVGGTKNSTASEWMITAHA